MPGEQGPLELGQDGPAEAVHPGPGIAAGGERGEQVVADFAAQVLVDVAGGTQFTNSEDFGAITHSSTVVLHPAANRGTSCRILGLPILASWAGPLQLPLRGSPRLASSGGAPAATLRS